MFDLSLHKKYSPVGKSFILMVAIINLLMLGACGGDKAPDVSGIKVEFASKRLDRDLIAIDTNNLSDGLQQVSNQYPVFFDLYLDQVMGFRIGGDYSSQNPGVQVGLRGFLTESDYRALFDTVQAHYPDTKDVEKELTKAFQYTTHYFPNYRTPQNITYFVCGLTNWAVLMYGDNGLAIGLDMFLGDGYPFYRSVGLQDFIKPQLRKEYIPVAVMRNIYQDMNPDEIQDKTLLDIMLMRGKEQYFLSKVLPFKEAHERLGYNKEQLEGCEENEGFIYNYFVQKDLLYVTSMERIFPFVNEGPGTPEISDQAPGNVGTWIGYRIVSAYMKEHPKATMDELFKMTDSQKLLLQSKYKPK